MKIYFKNLDGIRFFAALLVLIHHAFFFKRSYSESFAFVDRALEDAGRMGVNLFFVLSGFLISYLLLMEKDSTGTISYRSFYLRRVLRIWPLYLGYGLILTFFSPYVSAALGWGGKPDLPLMFLNLLFLLLFAVNFQMAFVGDNQGIFEVSWSVCIEEQFYLIWPLLINNFRKKLGGLVVVMFGISILSRITFYYILPSLYHDSKVTPFAGMNYEMLLDKLDLFGGGLLTAMVYYNRDRYKPLMTALFKPWLQVVMVALAFFYVFLPKRWDAPGLLFIDHYICDLLFGYMLLAAISERSIFRLETPLLKTMGKISYGMYLFHTAVCQFVLLFFRKCIGHPGSRVLYDLAYPFCCLVATGIIAYLSYTYYEMWFLKRKKKFEVVTTRI